MSRFYDYSCKNQQCMSQILHEFFEPTDGDKTKEHPCPHCGIEMQRAISLPSMNFRSAKGNQVPDTWRSKAERKRRWDSPNPRDKI